MTATCPQCLEDAAVRVDVTDGDTLTCSACEEEYTVADVVKVVESWGKLLPWVLSHTARAEEKPPTAN